MVNKRKSITVYNKSKLPVIDYKKLTDFQGSLKSIDKKALDKLKRSILKYGFSFPAAVWKNKNKVFIIDSHQRRIALSDLEAEGYIIPPIPYYEIQASNKAEAKKKLLLINSKYGKITEEGFIDFIQDIDFDFFKDIDITDINIEKLLPDNFDSDNIENQSNLDKLNKIKCPLCGGEFERT